MTRAGRNWGSPAPCSGGFRLLPQTRWLLLLGDETALPRHAHHPRLAVCPVAGAVVRRSGRARIPGRRLLPFLQVNNWLFIHDSVTNATRWAAGRHPAWLYHLAGRCGWNTRSPPI
ncbi:hypothetical protein M8494_33075 [Serratia ureilytica]